MVRGTSWKTVVRSRRATFAVLCVCALALGLIYLYQVHGSPLFDVLLIDSETYDRLAQRILEGRFRGEEVYFLSAQNGLQRVLGLKRNGSNGRGLSYRGDRKRYWITMKDTDAGRIHG